MTIRKYAIIGLVGALFLSLAANVLLFHKVRTTYAENDEAQFFRGPEKAVVILRAPILANIFGKDWEQQRLYIRTDSEGDAIYESNYFPVQVGTPPIIITKSAGNALLSLYSLDKKLRCGMKVHPQKGRVEYYVPDKQVPMSETIFPNGELKLTPPEQIAEPPALK